MPATSSIEDYIRGAAAEIGFDALSFARVGRPETAGSFLEWLANGYQAEMSYLERRVEARLDPSLVLDGARSSICVALQYHPLDRASAADEGGLWSRIARYALGRDYHDLLLDKLAQLEEAIREAYPGARTLTYVDTGPILERDLAAKAGLGVFGKNTNLLNPELGSWFLIGEILTTLALTPGQRLADLCGSCTQCLEACPTQAFPAPYVLDSSRCISYWTIEHRGAVPQKVRADLGGWVFGCDICQEVCPINVDVRCVDRPDFEVPEKRRSLDLAGLLLLEQEDYVDLFRGSAMKRAKLQGLKRNAALAMGNSGDERFVAPLANALFDANGASEVVRGHAAWALGQIGGAEASKVLAKATETETVPAVLDEIHLARRQCR